MSHGMLQGQHCVVVGGAGAVGALMADLLLSAGAEVCILDTAPPLPELSHRCAYIRGDVCALDAGLEARIRRADIVVLAVHERAALAAVPRLARALLAGRLLVDTLSVKTGIVAALADHAAHLEVVSLNPMFAPGLGFDRRAVAAVVVRDGPRAQALLGAVARRGARVLQLSADEHDLLSAVTQALTHATVLGFGLALDELGVVVEALGAVAPPPHLTLLAVLARITSATPETYWDVQATNPHAHRVRSALAAGLAELADVADHGTAPAFAAILERASRSLGPDRDAYARLCEELFGVARPPARTLSSTARDEVGGATW